MVDRDEGMEAGPGTAGGFPGVDPQAVSGHAIWHDPNQISAVPTRNARRERRIVHASPSADNTDVWNLDLRATIWAEKGATLDDVIAGADEVFAGSTGPHLPVVEYEWVIPEEVERE